MICACRKCGIEYKMSDSFGGSILCEDCDSFFHVSTELEVNTDFWIRHKNNYGHIMVTCPVCGKDQYDKPLQAGRHFKNHLNGYLTNEGHVSDKRNLKTLVHNVDKRLKELEDIVHTYITCNHP